MPATPDEVRYGIHAHAIDDKANHEWYELRPNRGGNNLSYDVKLAYIDSGGRWYGVEKGQPTIDVVVHMTKAAVQPNRGERLPLLLIQRDLRGDARLAACRTEVRENGCGRIAMWRGHGIERLS